jgi:hypothetical protein
MRNLHRTFLWFGLLLFSLPVVAADFRGNGRITGNVKNLSGNPLEDAVIRIVREVEHGEALSFARSDSRGFFRSVSLKPGTYYLQVSRHGYQPATTAKFVIDPGRTTSLDIVLQEFISFVTNDDDPRNWDLKTVIRSTSDRRFIFRDLPGGVPPDLEDSASSFSRIGAMNIASGTSLDGESYMIRPQSSQAGVSSNFAFTEPLSEHSRMILSGQLNFGAGAFWRVRNTYNYRPNGDHDYRLSVGYGQMNVDYPGPDSIYSQILSQDSGTRYPGMQTLAFGVEGNTQFLDFVSVKYGFDYSHLHYGDYRSFFYPFVQILIHPAEGWNVRTSFASRHVSDTNTVSLPNGEVLDLSEPTLITMVGNRISMSQIRHSEVSAEKEITQQSTLEIAVYQDRIQGPGLPVMITTITPAERNSQVVEMGEDHSGQRGLRLTLKRKIAENLSASVAYVYGDAVNFAGAGLWSTERLNGKLADCLLKQNQHSITGRVEAKVPRIKTNVLATTRWYSGNPLTPVDWFSDQMDIGTTSTNFEIRQPIPFPDFMGIVGRWEVMVDLRNILNQGKEIMPTSDGEIVLNRNPRSLRFGLSLSFR